MNNHIDARIAAIAAALERRRMEQEVPEDDLSRSLRELGQGLAGLGKLEQAALLAQLNHTNPLYGESGLNLDMVDLERFIDDYSEVRGLYL